MAQCRTCYATIVWAETRAGVSVPLDEHYEVSSGPNRFRIVDQGKRPIVEAVPLDSSTSAPVDHRTVCQQPVG
jgi:hypothetical protein